MALRVLLADEGSTIKKVFQLSLQDFGVEVQSVNLGVDVLDAAKKFKPDIIFVDILLQKKDGYEVCFELKNDPDCSSVPVVLMRSLWQDPNEEKIKKANPDSTLEKPFDTETLRPLVQKLVPKVKSNSLANFLTFSSPQGSEQNNKNPNEPIGMSAEHSLEASPEAEDDFIIEKTVLHNEEDNSELPDGFVIDSNPLPSPSQIAQTLNNQEPEETFIYVPVDEPVVEASANPSPETPMEMQESPIPSLEDAHTVYYQKPPELAASVNDTASNAISFDDADETNDLQEDLKTMIIPEDDLSQFRIEVPTFDDSRTVHYKISNDPIDTSKFETEPTSSPNIDPARLLESEEEAIDANEVAKLVASRLLNQLSIETIEKLIAKQAKEVIENAVWKIIPDLATRAVKDELDRLLKETENTP